MRKRHNGKIIPKNEACISLNDIGILRGFGVFEYIRTYNGVPLLLSQHLDRLEHSAELINLKVPISKAKLTSVINQLLLKNNLPESGIRIILTGGITRDSKSFSSPTLFVLIEELHFPPKSVYIRGIKLMTYEYQREFPKSKTINYITGIYLQKRLKEEGAFEVLYKSNGTLLECSTSNFFIFQGDTLITPKDNILLGIVRNLVINLARDRFKVEERAISIEEINLATEAFITATDKEIIPVVKIDNTIIGNGKVGKNTSYLISLFNQYITSYAKTT